MKNRKRLRRRLEQYPVSDGKPMAETDFHREVMKYLIQALERHLRGQAAYVSGNNFLYFVEGNPRIRVSPDVYVVFGVSGEDRDCYQSWKEAGRLPNVVFEITSHKTQGADTCVKRRLYELLRIQEYFLFDPRCDYLEPALQGFRLVNGSYEALEPVAVILQSDELGLDLVRDGWRVRLWDPTAQQWLPSTAELYASLKALLSSTNESTRRAKPEPAANAAVWDNSLWSEPPIH